MSTTPTRPKAGSTGIASALCLLLCLSNYAFPQATAEPERDQLLNGLKIVLWPNPGSATVAVKVRIHSGAAFDLTGKAGEMALLGDLLFPDPATTDYFTDEMGGRLDVNVNYDSITITMVGKASEFENIIEVLRSALLATQLSPEVVGRAKERRLKILRDTAFSPALLADRAVAARLFGDFPYGRPITGSAEDLERIDRGDLMLARDRFLNSNNATLAIVGGVAKARAMRTLRQLLGPWRKSEQIVPTTFRQPKAPDSRTLIINGSTQTTEVRLAMRGLSRSDSDSKVATWLAKLAQYRWAELTPELARSPIFVRSETHVLPGQFVMGTAIEGRSVADTIATARKVLDSLVTTVPTPAEMERVRKELAAERAAMLARPDSVADAWLDADTYRLASAQEEVRGLQEVSAADAQRVAARLLKDAPVATVVVGDLQQLKSALEGRLQFEVLGEPAAPIPSQKPLARPGSNKSPG